MEDGWYKLDADWSADCHSFAYTCEEASWDALAAADKTCRVPEHMACDVEDMVLPAE